MRKYLLFVTLLALFLAACSPASQAIPTTLPTDTPEDMPTEMAADMPATDTPTEMPTDIPPTEMPVDDNANAAYNGPDWTQTELVNARTGETFTLADFAGKTVYIEPMATWCTNCLRQQNTLKEITGNFSPDEVVFISLSVEPNDSDADLASYSQDKGFDWVFARATPVLQALVDQYGFSVTNPPSTSHFFLSPDGTASALFSGQHSAAELSDQLMEMG